jgi:hypothetical protein
VEKHLGVSYPTARQRFADVLDRLGLAEPPAPPSRDQILAAVAGGQMSPEQAERLLSAS